MEVFDNLEHHIQNPLVLQSVLSLMDRGTMVLTTNYDNLLEIFGQQQSKPMESLDLKDKTKVRAAGWGAGVSYPLRRPTEPSLSRQHISDRDTGRATTCLTCTFPLCLCPTHVRGLLTCCVCARGRPCGKEGQWFG